MLKKAQNQVKSLLKFSLRIAEFSITLKLFYTTKIWSNAWNEDKNAEHNKTFQKTADTENPNLKIFHTQ
jgi:hypothetical protein